MLAGLLDQFLLQLGQVVASSSISFGMLDLVNLEQLRLLATTAFT